MYLLKLINLNNLILYGILIFYNSQYTIYHKYFDPLLMIVFLFVYLYRNKIRIPKSNHKWAEINLLFISLICTLLWFLKFPIFRYGYSFIIISILMPVLLYFTSYRFENKKIFNNLKKIVILFFLVFVMLNLAKIYKNKNNNQWPNVFQAAVDDDYILTINDKKIKVTTADVCYYEKIICTNFIPPSNLKVTYFKNYTIINSNLQYHGAW